MNTRLNSRIVIPAAGIIYVIVGILAHSGVVWTVGALIIGLIAVVTTGLGRGRARDGDR